jgi:hypothetical protein
LKRISGDLAYWFIVPTRRGAFNIDSRCTGTTMRDYLRCTDLEHLPDVVVRLYDGTEIPDHILHLGERLATSSVSGQPVMVFSLR